MASGMTSELSTLTTGTNLFILNRPLDGKLPLTTTDPADPSLVWNGLPHNEQDYVEPLAALRNG